MSNLIPNPFAGWEREGKDCFRFQVRLIDPDLDNGIPKYVAMLGPDDYLERPSRRAAERVEGRAL
jgi:hypothetical protein